MTTPPHPSLPPLAPPTTLTIVTKQPLVGSFITPSGEVNGYPVGLRWGSNSITVPPGVHHVKIYMSWIWRYGLAEITVDNRSDPNATIYYAAPFVNFLAGAIGFTPVKSPGLAAFLAAVVAPVVLIGACCAAAAFGG